MRSRHALVLLLTAPLSLAAGAVLATPAAAAPPDRAPAVEVVAHRGSSAVAPENTLAAVRLAVQQKSDVVENDVQRTADGALVIMHDTTLTRTTDVEQVFPDRAPWNVGDLTLAEIKQLDAGSWFAPEFAGERVPTLAEWVEAVGPRPGMLIEVKAPELYPGIEVDVDKELRSLPLFERALRADKVAVQSFNHPWLRAYADLAPDVPVGLLFGATPTSAQLAEAATWADQANPALGVATEATIDEIHALGLEAHVWTVNDGAGMRRAISWGVDGVITNYPQVLRDIVRER